MHDLNSFHCVKDPRRQIKTLNYQILLLKRNYGKY